MPPCHRYEEKVYMHAETTILLETEVPIQVFNQMHKLIQSGWYLDEGDVLREALRRFLTIHGSETLERQIREDVAWGLYGKD